MRITGSLFDKQEYALLTQVLSIHPWCVSKLGHARLIAHQGHNNRRFSNILGISVCLAKHFGIVLALNAAQRCMFYYCTTMPRQACACHNHHRQHAQLFVACGLFGHGPRGASHLQGSHRHQRHSVKHRDADVGWAAGNEGSTG